ncbi:DUF981 domain-containing protein [Rhodoglobus aureus]|uniref:DUF981 domain-containing protein n=2 Tax=Rhodoglobus aureus TaxID=191497 RepID=A0ABN1VQB1_9MICO
MYSTLLPVFTGVMDQGLVIDWTQMPTYNTIMAVAAGAGLLSLVLFARKLMAGAEVDFRGYSANFGVLGLILTITGAHMTLTWPFAAYFPFDNIIFGEPSLAFGVLLLAASFVLWRRAAVLEESADAARTVARTAEPLGVLIFGLGLALVGIAAAGVAFQLFVAPPEEPISGYFSQWPWVEITFMSGLFALVGLGALLFPFATRTFAVRSTPTKVQWVAGVSLALGGIAFLLFGALNFFTHIGLIVNTMG